METYNDYVKERISNLRSKKGVSARNMSLSIGQSENYINVIENGYSLPSMTSFFCICKYLDITPKEFFDNDSSNPKLINDIVDVLKKMNDIQLENILSFINNFKN